MKKEGLPVLGSACKERGSHHCVLTISKKLNRLKNLQLILALWETEDPGQNDDPRLDRQTGEY